jgi:hypothetical protein
LQESEQDHSLVQYHLNFLFCHLCKKKKKEQSTKKYIKK